MVFWHDIRALWLNSHEFEFHYPYLFDKHQAQGNVNLYKFPAQRAFIWGGVLENNINYTLEPHLTT
jgi:hypothetical protein